MAVRAWPGVAVRIVLRGSQRGLDGRVSHRRQPGVDRFLLFLLQFFERLLVPGGPGGEHGAVGAFDWVAEGRDFFPAYLVLVFLEWYRYSCFWHILRGWLKGVRWTEAFLLTF